MSSARLKLCSEVDGSVTYTQVENQIPSERGAVLQTSRILLIAKN